MCGVVRSVQVQNVGGATETCGELDHDFDSPRSTVKATCSHVDAGLLQALGHQSVAHRSKGEEERRLIPGRKQQPKTV